MDQPPGIWTYIKLRDYKVPSAPVTEVARKGLLQWWRRLRSASAPAAAPAPDVTRRSSEKFFEDLFSPPVWDAGASALGHVVDAHLAGSTAVQVFVGGPHRCTPDMLRLVARDRGWTVMEAPTPDQVFNGTFRAPLLTGDGAVVIPQLAHWYFRHDAGLDLVRGLLDWIRDAPRPVVLGCHSWAWSYLDTVIGAAATLPEPWVLAPLDAAALSSWLRERAAHAGVGQIVFREAATGPVVLALPGEPEDAGVGEPSNLLTHIACQGRGIPEITWSVWRRAVLSIHEASVTDATITLAAGDQRTVWLPAWSDLHLPLGPVKEGHLPLFLVHAMLLHAGVPTDVLPALLPFSRADIAGGLRLLEVHGVAECEDGRWRVAAAAYPAVRNVLQDEGYLVDGL